MWFMKILVMVYENISKSAFATDRLFFFSVFTVEKMERAMGDLRPYHRENGVQVLQK